MIDKKPKKQKEIFCKPSGKANGFKSCGKQMTEFEKRTFGICNSCLYDFYTTDERGKIEFEKRKIKVKKVSWKEQKKVLKEKVKTLSDWKADLQTEINSIVRLIDFGHPCIATGSFKGKMNAGHYIGVLANPTTRYHLENIWLQSEHSNMWKSGDTLHYQDGIVNLYGKDYLEHLNSLKSIEPIKLTTDDIKEKIYTCRKILKWLKSEERIFTTEQRQSLRISFNKEIGIYN